MTAGMIILLAVPACAGLCYATAWVAAFFISRTCDCDFCSQDDVP